MKKSLLVAILLLPLAFAKASSGSQIVPLPDCFPCEPDPRKTPSAARIVPLPDCFPCEPDSLNIRNTTGTTVTASVRGLRREA